MYRAKGHLWPLHTHLLAMSLRSLLRHFAFPTDANYARSSKFAEANLGFHLFASRHGPRALSPEVEHEIPILVFTRSSMPGFHALIVKAISMINAWYKGKDIRKNVLVPSCYQISLSYRKVRNFK